MESTRPSQRKTSSDDTIARVAHELFVSEPAILKTIVSFVPLAPRVQDKPTKSFVSYWVRVVYSESTDPAWEPAFGVDNTFATIAALCRAFPTLGKLLGPANDDFWRSMVLQRFDFSVDPARTFNVGEKEAQLHYTFLRGHRALSFPEPIRRAVKEYEAAHRDAYCKTKLEHDLAFWPSIGAFFRPAEYGFLRDIQEGHASITTWPERESAFTLYQDLALVQDKLGTFDKLETWSQGEQFVYPCVLSSSDGELADDNAAMLKHCGFIPECWVGFVHPRWSGFNDPLPPPAAMVVDYCDAFGKRTEEEKRIFPYTNYDTRCFEGFRGVVHESFDDWRRVHVNEAEGSSPEFYIGKSKLSGRWLGYVGESDDGSMLPPGTRRSRWEPAY